MNILCLDQFGELGGAQRCLLDLLPAMAARDWNIHLAAPAGPLGDHAAALSATFDPIVCGPYTSGRKTLADMARFVTEAPRLSRQIGELLRRYRVDLLYVNGPRLLPAAALAARGGTSLLFHAHSLLDGIALSAAGRALQMSRASVVAACRFVAEPLRSYARHPIQIIYNGVRPITLPPRHAAAGEFRIGVIGRISPEKGQAEFLRAARIVHAAHPHCRFLICGAPLFSDPAAARCRATLESLAAGLPIEFTGWTEDIEAVLARLDLLAVPSVSADATPRVILEAFSAGVPVIAFATGGIPELISHSLTGLLAPPPSPEALASALIDALATPNRLRQIAESARTQARLDFTLERYRHQMLEAIQSAVK